MGHNYNKISLRSFFHAQERGKMIHCALQAGSSTGLLVLVDGVRLRRVQVTRMPEVGQAGRVDVRAGGQDGQAGNGHGQKKDQKQDSIHDQRHFFPL